MSFPNILNYINKTKYVTSIGFMKEFDDNKAIYYDILNSHIDWDRIINNGKDGCCIFVKGNKLNEFISIFHKINFRFILIVGDTDETIPDSVMDIDTFYNLINDDKIIKWYSTNCIENMHHKLSLLPFGLCYHCDAIFHNIPIYDQETMIENIRLNAKPFYERICLCYSNFHFSQYPNFSNPRRKAIENIKPELVFYEPVRISREETYKNQTNYSFVISPFGNGMDCVRTWEALILGCIVIVQKSPLDPLYEDLPVLIVNDWKEITEDLLKNTIINFQEKKFLYEKLTFEYWVTKIRNLK
jgi:hypothetical protein